MTGDRQTWQEGFKKALIDVMVTRGYPVSDKANWFGWADYDSAKREYLALVGIDYESTGQPKESYWDEFMGTFYEGDTTVWGADAWIVALDGEVFHWRWSGRVVDLIQQVIGEG